MRNNINWLAAVSAIAALTTVSASGADQKIKATAREVFEKNQAAVVSIKVVLTTRYVIQGAEENKQEQKMELSGTIIDAGGLTVTSMQSTDLDEMMSFSFDHGGEKTEFKPKTDISDIKIVLADGTEIPSQFVLRDKDLDLAFVKPKEKPSQPLPFVALAKASAEPEVLDEVISLGRLGREVNREASVALGLIQAIVRKPRTSYVTSESLANIGCPIFNKKGESLGLLVTRKNPVKDNSGGYFSFGGMQVVVLPSEDVLDAAKQALSGKEGGEAKK